MGFAATTTPDPTYSNLSPITSGSATLPFTITWDVVQGSYEAAYSWIQIYDTAGSTDEAKNYQAVVPASTKSLEITSSNIHAGNIYLIFVLGVNSMSVTGGATGSLGYVGGGNAVASNNVTVN